MFYSLTLQVSENGQVLVGWEATNICRDNSCGCHFKEISNIQETTETISGKCNRVHMNFQHYTKLKKGGGERQEKFHTQLKNRSGQAIISHTLLLISMYLWRQTPSVV